MIMWQSANISFAAMPLWRTSLPVLALLLSSCGVGVNMGEPVVKEQPYYHQAAPLVLQHQASYTVNRLFVGQAAASQQVSLGFELSGTLLQVLVDEGDSVQQGQLLASLDTRLLRSRQQQLDAGSAEIIAQTRLSQLELNRQQKLLKQGFAAEQRIDELIAEQAVLTAKKLNLQAQQAELDIRIAQSSLYAPYAGKVSQRLLDDGAVVSAGQRVLQVLAQANNQAEVGVPAQFVNGLQLGERLSLKLNNTDISAELVAIGNSLNTASQTVSLRLALPADAAAADGELLYLVLPEVRQQAGFWVATGALTTGVRGLWNVLVMVPEADSGHYRLEARSVDVLHMEGNRAYIKGAINNGETVVASGTQRFAIGQIVRSGVTG
jgi:RND family efflux transporter MFP subunit